MTRRIYWGLAILMVLLIGVFSVLLMRDTENEPIVIYKPPTQEVLDNIDKKLKTTKQPPPGASPHGHWHDGEWHEPHQPPVADDMSKTELVQVESVVIDGVGDLKEWLTFFESFGDDPSLDTMYELDFNKKRIQFRESMRGFDYNNAAPEVIEMLNMINEKALPLAYLYSAKLDAERERFRKLVPENRIPVFVARPDEEANEGGSK